MVSDWTFPRTRYRRPDREASRGSPVGTPADTRRWRLGVAALTLLVLALSTGDAGARPARVEKTIALGTGRAYRFKGMAMDAAAGVVYLASWDRQRLVA